MSVLDWLGAIADGYAIVVLTFAILTYSRRQKLVTVILQPESGQHEPCDVTRLIQITRSDLSRSELWGRLGTLPRKKDGAGLGNVAFAIKGPEVTKEINRINSFQSTITFQKSNLVIKLEAEDGNFDLSAIRQELAEIEPQSHSKHH